MKTSASVKCTEPGCGEWAHFAYDTREDAAEDYAKRREWKCTRHRRPDEVLSVERKETKVEMVNTTRKTGLYWSGSHGFTFGPGFKAWSKDFPEGTKLIVTARIELPEL